MTDYPVMASGLCSRTMHGRPAWAIGQRSKSLRCNALKPSLCVILMDIFTSRGGGVRVEIDGPQVSRGRRG
jgi:hypothetical protein